MTNPTCPRCGGKNVTVKALKDYSYSGAGLKNVRLRKGVTELSCADCRGEFHSVPREQQLLQVIAIWLLQKPAPLEGEEWKYIRKTCGLTQEQVTQGLKKPRRGTISDWERKEKPGLDFNAEIGTRLYYLHAFEKKIAKREACYLDPVHLQRLEELKRSISGLYETLTEEKTRIEIDFSKDQAWIPELRRAA